MDLGPLSKGRKKGRALPDDQWPWKEWSGGLYNEALIGQNAYNCSHQPFTAYKGSESKTEVVILSLILSSQKGKFQEAT